MEIEIHLDSVHERENALTVVRGCLGTVMANWDRLDEGMKKTLLQTGLQKVEDLVRNLEQDVKSLRTPERSENSVPAAAR